MKDGYDAWLENGLDGLEVEELMLVEVKAANRKYPHSFELDCYVAANNGIRHTLVNNSARRLAPPGNAKALRIDRRIARRLIKKLSRDSQRLALLNKGASDSQLYKVDGAYLL